MQLKYCFHTHTKRCGHAFGTDEEYVLSAIENGYEQIGFTDHVILPDLIQDGTRGRPDELKDYIRSIRHLKRKYRKQIKIYIGFECEWFNGRYLKYYKKLLKRYKFDYLILGEHSYLVGDKFTYYSHTENKYETLKLYTESAIQALNSGLFSYFAHPDFFNIFTKNWDDEVEKYAEKLIKEAVRLHIPLEINMGRTRLGGYYEGKNLSNVSYPCLPFWKLAKKYDAEVIIGIDAHAPKDFYCGPFDYFDQIIKKIDLNIISSFPFKKGE